MAYLLLSSSDEEAGSDPPGPGRDPNEAKVIAAASLPAQLAQKKSKRKAPARKGTACELKLHKIQFPVGY